MRALSKLGGRPKPQAKNAQALQPLTKKTSNTSALRRKERAARLAARSAAEAHSFRFTFGQA